MSIDLAKALRQLFDAIEDALRTMGMRKNARWLETLGYLNIQLGYVVGHGTDTGFHYIR